MPRIGPCSTVEMCQTSESFFVPKVDEKNLLRGVFYIYGVKICRVKVLNELKNSFECIFMREREKL